MHFSISALMCKFIMHFRYISLLRILISSIPTYSRHNGFVALGMSRLLPKWLLFFLPELRRKVDRLYRYASLTVRDVQHAVLSLGYTADELLKNCPKAPDGNEEDPSIRRLKAVFSHPIGKKLFVCFDYIILNMTSNSQYLLLHRRLRRTTKRRHICRSRCYSGALHDRGSLQRRSDAEYFDKTYKYVSFIWWRSLN